MHCVNNPIRLFAFRVQVTDSIFQDRHCERKRSNPCCREVRMDCFVALLLAMTSNPDMHTHSRGATRPSFARQCPSIDRGRRECQALDAPAPSRAKLSEAPEHSPHRYTGNHPAFPAQWFYGLLRALPGDQAFLTPSSRENLRDLTPASGRQNHTTWPYASASFVRLAFARLTLPRPPHPAPRSYDARSPLWWDRMAGVLALICPTAKAKNFFPR